MSALCCVILIDFKVSISCLRGQSIGLSSAYIQALFGIDNKDIVMKKSSTMGQVQGWGLAAITRFASSKIADQWHLRKLVERILYQGSKTGFKVATTLSRQFKSSPNPQKVARLDKPKSSGLFDLSLTDEQQMTQETLQRFAKEVIRPAASKADHDHTVTKELLQQAQELGLIYYAVPEAFGGVAQEQSTVTQMLALEALGHGDFSIAAAIFAQVSAANVLTRYGTEWQQNTYLTEFTSENPPSATLAFTESHALFNPQMPVTQLIREGDSYRLIGSKSLVLMAEDSEFFIVSAQLEQQTVLVIVESGSEGFSITANPAMGLKAAKTSDVHFNHVHISEQHIIRDINIKECLDLGALALCALAVGTSQAVLDYVVPYVNEREAFGEPISHRQAVAFMVADIAIEIDAMRMMVWRACALAEQGKPFHREAHLARILCQEKAMEIGSNGVQLLGGHGFTKEHPVERWYRDLRAVAVLHNAISL